MSPQSKSDLACEHLARARTAFEAGDPVVGVTFLHLAAEAAIVALSELHGITTERQHWRKAEAASELRARGIVSVDLNPILALLNQARKDAGYEGEAPDLGDWTTKDLVDTVEVVVDVARDGALTAGESAEESTS
ncbi:MAG: HEPN domain-containing protein [Solirubrobacteraceae bacterium]